MLSAVIPSILSYPALQLALQPVHQWYVHPGPLVLGTAPLNSSTRIADRDRTVSRRSKPSSRTTLIGEQPNPWDLLQPQDVTHVYSNVSIGIDYIIILQFNDFVRAWRLMNTKKYPSRTKSACANFSSVVTRSTNSYFLLTISLAKS